MRSNMRTVEFEKNLQKKIRILYKKDKALYIRLQQKVQEIEVCQDIDHYKNLRKPLEELKRVHVKGPFVLIFSYIPSEDRIIFWDIDHHDVIYTKKKI